MAEKNAAMNKSNKPKCYIIFMEDDHLLRTPIAVCLSKRNAEHSRQVLAQADHDYKFVVEECPLIEPIRIV